MANITWNLTDKDLKDNWSNYLDHKNNAPDIKTANKDLINYIINNYYKGYSKQEIIKIIDEHTKEHENTQTTHIKKNTKNLKDINNINIWTTYK